MFTLIYSFTKENSVKMIIKDYATLAIIIKIDDSFAQILLPKVREISVEIYCKEKLKTGKNLNSFKQFYKEAKRIDHR